MAIPLSPPDLLQHLQKSSFGYFIHEVNPSNGLVIDKTADGSPASIAAIGMALTAYPVGIERGFIGRDEGAGRTLATLRFFAGSEQGTGVDATGYRGFYYHFLDMQSGRRARRSELSSIDTAFFIAGALAAAEYFDASSESEAEIRALAKTLYERVEWDWMLAGSPLICHGWRPERGGAHLRYHWQGYDEALLLYLLALGSPTHGIGPEAYQAWCSTYRWKTIYGVAHVYAGPLFIHQYSHAWVDFRGIRDAYMRNRGIDYFENSRRATQVQRLYGARNPRGHAGLSELSWGITASDGPGPAVETVDGVRRRFYDYKARGVPFGPDDGTLAPSVVLASLPFAPEIVIPTVLHYRDMGLQIASPYGFRASFNPGFTLGGSHPVGWESTYHFGINEGPVVLMIENFRSGLVWRLMRGCAPLVAGLRLAGFTGGWLGDVAHGP